MGKKGHIKNPPIVGETHNRLTIIKDLKRLSGGKSLVECSCVCGKRKICRIDSIRDGVTKSCGCIRRPNVKGKKYKYLTAVEYVGENRAGHSMWLFRCVCKNTVIRNAAQVRANNTLMHCGCKSLKPNEAAFNALYSHYKGSAKFRKVCFNLSRKIFKNIVDSDCYYCGQKPYAIIKGPSFRRPYIYNGIDRVNNNVGYTKKNCVPCCKVCNVAKATYTQKFFIEWSKRLYFNLKGKKL